MYSEVQTSHWHLQKHAAAWPSCRALTRVKNAHAGWLPSTGMFPNSGFPDPCQRLGTSSSEAVSAQWQAHLQKHKPVTFCDLTTSWPPLPFQVPPQQNKLPASEMGKVSEGKQLKLAKWQQNEHRKQTMGNLQTLIQDEFLSLPKLCPQRIKK